MGGAQYDQALQLDTQASVTDRGWADQNHFGILVHGAEVMPHCGFRARTTVGRRPGTGIVLVED